jgi:hypothetical protein
MLQQTGRRKVGAFIAFGVVMVSTTAIAAAMYDSPHLYLHLLRVMKFSGVRTAISDLTSEDMSVSMSSAEWASVFGPLLNRGRCHVVSENAS